MLALRKGDVGTLLRWTVEENSSESITTVVNVSAATVKQAKIIKPNGTHVTWTLRFSTKASDSGDGVDGRVEYAIVLGDLDQKGTYKWQLFFNLATWNGSSQSGTFIVEDILT